MITRTETEPYPSKADQYGAAQLMRMGGTLAGQVEQALGNAAEYGHATRAEILALKAAAAAAYATLANAAAIREAADQLCEALASIHDAISVKDGANHG